MSRAELKAALERDRDNRKDFVRGYACAVAMIKASHDPGTPVVEALEACGLTSIRKLRVEGVDDYDIQILRPVIREMQANERFRRMVSKLQSTEEK